MSTSRSCRRRCLGHSTREWWCYDDAGFQLLAELGGAAGSSDITELRHVRTSAEKRAAEEIANRQKCEDFGRFKPLFEKVQNEIESGVRHTRPFELKAEIRLGSWLIVGGQKAYVEEMGEVFANAQGNPMRARA
jgi:hypothetical protein